MSAAFCYVNDVCATDAPQVYAVGDCVRGPMLAHKGMEEGVMVAERIAGKKPMVNYDCIPSVIYTHPGNRVGRQEPNRKSRAAARRTTSAASTSRRTAARWRRPIRKGSSRSLPMRRRTGFSAFTYSGPQASELIAQAVIAMEFSASAEDLGVDDVRASDVVRSGARSRAGGGRSRDSHDQSKKENVTEAHT